MLAQNFLTAAELCIEDHQHAALIKVLGMLERGELHHTKNYRSWLMPDEARKHTIGTQFNMGAWQAQNRYGTVCCIGGAAEWLGGKGLGTSRNPALDELFYPCLFQTSLHKITPAQAAVALRNYLTTGRSNWSEVLTQ